MVQRSLLEPPPLTQLPAPGSGDRPQSQAELLTDHQEEEDEEQEEEDIRLEPL